eukprot:SAG31_NODE_3846_length_3819_cov_9.633871_2_plen_525_part_00
MKLGLINWLTVEHAQLDFVFKEEEQQRKRAAQDLIAWCLQKDPSERPTITQILTHPFLAFSRRKEEKNWRTLQANSCNPLKRLRHHFFISHYQAEASDFAQQLHFRLRHEYGCSSWVDMQMKEINVAAMKDGVAKADVFLLVLTTGTLFREFCLLELWWAIRLDKAIVVLQEEDHRFGRFDMSEWQAATMNQNHTLHQAHQAARRKLTTRFRNGELDVDAQVIFDAVAQRLSTATTLPIRRRSFEQKAMLRELLRHCQFRSTVNSPRQIELGNCMSACLLAPAGSCRQLTTPMLSRGVKLDAWQGHHAAGEGFQHLAVCLSPELLDDAAACAMLASAKQVLPIKSIQLIWGRTSGCITGHTGGQFDVGRLLAAVRSDDGSCRAFIADLFEDVEVLMYKYEYGPDHYENSAALDELAKRLRESQMPTKTMPKRCQTMPSRQQLRDALRQVGLPVSGRKDELQARLDDHHAATAAAATATEARYVAWTPTDTSFCLSFFHLSGAVARHKDVAQLTSRCRTMSWMPS